MLTIEQNDVVKALRGILKNLDASANRMEEYEYATSCKQDRINWEREKLNIRAAVLQLGELIALCRG